MLQRNALSGLIFIGISFVKLIFGYVMNVNFRKILVRLLDSDVPCHIATVRWK